jgi:hypothetical protein
MPEPKTSDDRRERTSAQLARVDFSGPRGAGRGHGPPDELCPNSRALVGRAGRLVPTRAITSDADDLTQRGWSRDAGALAPTARPSETVSGGRQWQHCARFPPTATSAVQEVRRALTPGGSCASRYHRTSPASLQPGPDDPHVFVARTRGVEPPHRVGVDLHNAAQALRSAGFENSTALLAGYALTQRLARRDH